MVLNIPFQILTLTICWVHYIAATNRPEVLDPALRRPCRSGCRRFGETITGIKSDRAANCGVS